MGNKSLNKTYSYLVEGETEEDFFRLLKTDIFRSKKLHKCKIHSSSVAHGTIPINKIKAFKNCCTRIYIMDQTDIGREKSEYLSKEKQNNLIIISNPIIEIVFYAFFNVCETEMDKDTCIKKLNLELNKIGMVYDKNKKLEFIENFIKLLQIDNNLNKWIENLKKLNKYKHSNFIEIINFLKMERGKNGAI